MTENLQADCVQSRQAGFIQCFLKAIPHKERLATLHTICMQKTTTRLIHLLCMKPIPGTPDGFNILGV